MLNKVKNVLKPYNNKKLVLSVSGGIDSIVLLELLIKLKHSFVVVHFNHQQRKQSEKEALYIKNLCQKKNIPLEYFILEIDEDENFQSHASLLRKNHLIEVAKKYNTNVIVTAHQLNDLAETIILKISRGSNLLGYAGMQQSYFKHEMFFLKPLLYVSKQEITTYAKKNNITYFEDESNVSSIYTRNRVRHNVIPYLIEDNPAFLNKIIEYNNSLSAAFNYIRKNTIEFLNDSLIFQVSKFKELDEALQVDIIAYLLEEYNSLITTEKIDLVKDFILCSGPNKTIDIGENLQFKKSYDEVYIEEEISPVFFMQELSFEKENFLKNGDVIIFNNNFNVNNNNEFVLCYNKLVLPLYARTRKPGDKLYFSFGHKKLKDFYIDKKIPLQKRNNDVLIVDKSDTVLAVLGRYYNENANLKDKITLTYRRKQNGL